MKTGPLISAYTLAGKDNADGYYYYSDFALRILPGGGVRAYVIDTNKTQWKAEMVGKVYDPTTGGWKTTLEDNQWHHLAMVVNRTTNRLILYVDGIERANTPAPANFGAMQNMGEPFRAGHYAYYDGWGGLPYEFPGTLDEVRVLNYARTAAQVYDVFYGTSTAGPVTQLNAPTRAEVPPPAPQLRVTSVAPTLVARDHNAESAVTTNLTVAGAELSGIAARVMRDRQPLTSVAATVRDSADAEAHVALAVAPNTPLGLAQLVLSKTGYADAIVEIRVVEQSEFAAEPDTVGLWHLDERDEGVAHLFDAGPSAINLTSAQASRAAAGRFGSGRTLARATADANSNALSLGMSSFTVEGWVKSEALQRDYVLIGKEINTGQNTDFTLKALASGALRAEIYDASGLVWQAETLPGTGSLTDGQWHAVALVVDRESGVLLLYVDGELHMAAPAATGFAGIRNLGQPLELGCFDADGPAAGGPEEFPGVLDELRISSTAHKAEKIALDFFGHDEPQLTLIRPVVVAKGAPVEVTLSGYGLAGATATANQQGITVNVASTSATSIKCSVTVADSIPAGPALLTFTDAQGRNFSIEFTVAERQTRNRLGVQETKPTISISPAAGEASRSISGRPSDTSTPASRVRKSAGAALRASRFTQDAKPVGGQR